VFFSKHSVVVAIVVVVVVVAEGLQQNLNTIATANERAGLTVNTKKTKDTSPGSKFTRCHQSSPSFSIAGNTINTVSQFT